jgi:molybdate transport system regulatory protein
MNDLKCSVRVRLTGNETVFGPGIAELLTRVRDGSSLSTACRDMNMAYSKAWRIIKRAEKELGYSLTEGKSGGSSGGSTTLTKEGEIFLEKYLSLESDIKKAARDIFEKYDFK